MLKVFFLPSCFQNPPPILKVYLVDLENGTSVYHDAIGERTIHCSTRDGFFVFFRLLFPPPFVLFLFPRVKKGTTYVHSKEQKERRGEEKNQKRIQESNQMKKAVSKAVIAPSTLK